MQSVRATVIRAAASAVLAVSLVATPQALAQSPLSPEKIGIDLLKSIVSSFAGSAARSIFGDRPVTKRQLESVLDNRLAEYRKVNIKVDVGALSRRIGQYSGTASVDDRRRIYQDILLMTAQLQEALDQQITQAGRFWTFVPDYIMVTNALLAFQAERRLVETGDRANQSYLLASYAVDGLNALRGYFRSQFVDERKFDCLRYTEQQILYNAQGLPLQYSKLRIFGLANGWEYFIGESYKLQPLLGMRRFLPTINPKTEFCRSWLKRIHNLFDIKRIPHGDFFVRHASFQITGKFMGNLRGKWYFVYGDDQRKNEGVRWLVGPFNRKADAEGQRARLGAKSFTRTLGDVPTVASHWREIAVRMGDSREGIRARIYAKFLGAPR